MNKRPSLWPVVLLIVAVYLLAALVSVKRVGDFNFAVKAEDVSLGGKHLCCSCVVSVNKASLANYTGLSTPFA